MKPLLLLFYLNSYTSDWRSENLTTQFMASSLRFKWDDHSQQACAMLTVKSKKSPIVVWPLASTGNMKAGWQTQITQRNRCILGKHRQMIGLPRILVRRHAMATCKLFGELEATYSCGMQASLDSGVRFGLNFGQFGTNMLGESKCTENWYFKKPCLFNLVPNWHNLCTDLTSLPLRV